MSYLVRDHYNVEVRYCGIVETNMIPLHYTELFCFGVVPRASDAGRRTRSVQRHINQDTGNWKAGERTGSTPVAQARTPLTSHLPLCISRRFCCEARRVLERALRMVVEGLIELGFQL